MLTDVILMDLGKAFARYFTPFFLLNSPSRYPLLFPGLGRAGRYELRRRPQSGATACANGPLPLLSCLSRRGHPHSVRH